MHAVPTNRPRETLGMAAALAGLATTLITAAACVGPLVAILLGVGGFGWLTQYAFLRVPATLATIAVLAFGFHVLRRRERAGCGFQAPRTHRAARAVLWLAVVLAVSVNAFEYLIFPHLG